MIKVVYRRAPPLKILDFDIENRPLAYLGADFTTAEITAIAVSWVGEPQVYVWLLGINLYEAMLEGFRTFYDEADVVTGHYVLHHDLPVINGALLECGEPPLAAKLVSDTKVHLIKRRHISASQEALAGMFGLSAGKHHMTNPMWREANRLTPEGIEQTRKRVTHDVVQHKALREKLVELNALRPPTVWKP